MAALAKLAGCFAVAAAVAPPHVPRPPHRRAVPAKAAPKVTFVLEAPDPVGPWILRLRNDDAVPVNVLADARLITLEVTERSARRPVRCELPADMRPPPDGERTLLVPPQRSYVESFEPRLYCFGAAADALQQGAIVVAHLGWPGAAVHPPYAVWPVDGVEPAVSPLRELTAPPVALPDAPTPPLEAPSAAPGPRLSLQGPRYLDAPYPAHIEVPVTLRNESSERVTLRFRPETLRFEVTSATGKVDCPWPTLPGAATRNALTTLPPHGATSLDVMLDAYCDSRVFDAPGVFEVRPRLDTREASGADLGVRTFDGLVTGARATVVRLHSGRVPQPLRRPALVP